MVIIDFMVVVAITKTLIEVIALTEVSFMILMVLMSINTSEVEKFIIEMAIKIVIELIQPF